MSVDAAASLSALPALPAEALGPLDLPGGLAEAGAVPSGPLTPDAALPAFGLEGAPMAGDAWAQAHAETAPWGNPADELAAGGQMRGLTDMARELARSSHALRSPEDAATASRADIGGTPAEATLVARAGAEAALPAATLLAGVVPAFHPGAAERLRPAREDTPSDRPGVVGRDHRGGSQQQGDPDHEQPAGAEREREDDAGEDHPAHGPVLPVAEPAPEAPWGAPLLAALQQAARQAAARDALQAAAGAWEHGRAVLLACPMAAGSPHDAWLFVLRPARGPGALRLCGERLAARLRWAAPAGAGRWWAVRVAKSYSLRRGGQLVTQDEQPDGRVSCELQLGPFPAVLPRWRDVLVRVDLAGRLWQALGTQWSLPLLVCDQALLETAHGDQRSPPPEGGRPPGGGPSSIQEVRA
jgi:hypothetical protein